MEDIKTETIGTGTIGAKRMETKSIGAEEGAFTIEKKCPLRDGMTISRDTKLGTENRVTYFSLGKDSSISQESYDCMTMYLGAAGVGNFLVGNPVRQMELKQGDLLLVQEKTLCGVESIQGTTYVEIIIKKETKTMNNIVKAGEILHLKNLISYEEGCITNLDIAKNEKMKFVLMAFDEGTGLQPHRAPGNAILFAIEGKAIVQYEGKDYPLSAGECFRFEKNGLHSVTADGRFKMALLLVIE